LWPWPKNFGKDYICAIGHILWGGKEAWFELRHNELCALIALVDEPKCVNELRRRGRSRYFTCLSFQWRLVLSFRWARTQTVRARTKEAPLACAPLGGKTRYSRYLPTFSLFITQYRHSRSSYFKIRSIGGRAVSPYTWTQQEPEANIVIHLTEIWRALIATTTEKKTSNYH